jgi:Flp pilus assembly protein protease CpaA
VTLAGTKTVVLTGQLVLANNKDVLMITVPNSLSASSAKALVKVEGTAGVTELPAN